ncbi:unnamed protein product [Gordionus sp. m RMFG-2023]
MFCLLSKTTTSSQNYCFLDQIATLKGIQAIVDKLNIQVDNLCQFLPQDRVADFAKMNSCELLENTEKAVGDTQLYEKHQQLKSLYTEINEVKKMAKNTEQLLETERAQNQRLEQEVQNFKSKRKFIQQIENMKKKISWLVYSKRKQDLDTKKASLKTQLKKLEESKRSFNEKEKNYSEAETCIKKYSQLFEQKVDAIDNLLDSRLMPTLLQCRSLYSNQISQAKDDYELKLDSIQIGNNQIVRLTSDISELEKQSANESSKFEKVQPELKRSLGEKREHHQKLSQNKSLEEKIKNDFENLNAEKQKILRDIEFQRSRFDYKLENIKHKSQDAYKAYQWLTSNQHLFKHKIIGPISLYMKFKSLEGSQYMENQIGFQEWMGFLCFDQSDFVLFLRKVRKELNLKITIFLERFIDIPHQGNNQNDRSRRSSNVSGGNHNTSLSNRLVEDSEKFDRMYSDLDVARTDSDQCPFTSYIKSNYAPSHNIPDPNSNPNDLNHILSFMSLFDCHLRDYIHSCPFEIANFLCRKHKIHEIPICRKEETMSSSIIQKKEMNILTKCKQLFSMNIPIKLSSFYALSTLVKITRSRYRPGEPCLDQTQVRNKSNFFTQYHVFNEADNKDSYDDAYKKLESQLLQSNEALKACKSKEKELSDAIRQINTQIQELNKHKNTQNIIETKLKSLKARLDNEKRNMVDADLIKRQLEEKLQAINSEIYVKLKANSRAFKASIDERDVMVKHCLSILQTTILSLDQKMGLDQAKSGYETLKSEVQSLKEECDNMMSHLEESVRQLTRRLETQNFKNANNVLTLDATLMTEFEDLPNDIDKLEEKISSIKTRAEMLVVGENVVEEYHSRQLKIDSLQQTLSTYNAQSYTLANKKIAPLHKEWIRELTLLVKKIDEKFSQFFERISCVGQDEAKSSLPEYDMFKYGLDIKVQFRQEDTQKRLNHKHQSGGERSVSTIFFLLSLQELTCCPFRMVDEINQGMDQLNESKVLELIVELSSKPNVPQYFLLTPKLLPNAKFGGFTKFLVLIRTNLPEEADEYDNHIAGSSNDNALMDIQLNGESSPHHIRNRRRNGLINLNLSNMFRVPNPTKIEHDCCSVVTDTLSTSSRTNPLPIVKPEFFSPTRKKNRIR